jgi:endonuclease YncB( thermonuclease family)
MARAKSPRYAMSRYKKNALVAAFFFFLLPLAVMVDRLYLRPVRQVVQTAVWASDDRKHYHDRTFAVVSVIDGDTLDVDAPDGDRPATRIRLIGVDTPEIYPLQRKMHFGPEASAYAKSQLEGRHVTVRLDTVAEERCRYGRLLAYVVLADGRVLNEELIRNGYGYADVRFPHTHSETYLNLMETAISQKVGLWQDAERTQLPQWLQRIRPELLR